MRYLKHCQEQVLLAAFVLISIDGEHDRLQERINFGHGHQSTKVGDVSRFGLQ